MGYRTALESLTSDGSLSEGWYQRRLDSSSPLGLFAAMCRPGHSPALIAEVSRQSLLGLEAFPECRGLGFELSSLPEATTTARLLWFPKSKTDQDVFVTLAEDLHAHSRTENSESAGIRAVVERLKAWQIFLSRLGRSGLSPAEQEGLAGELTVVLKLLDFGFEPGHILAVWLGPEGGVHDFKFASASIEVKSIIDRPNATVRVSNLCQLDETLVPDLKAALVVLTEEEEGLSIPDLIDAIVAKLSKDEQAVFDNKLLKAGYLDSDRAYYAGRPFLLKGLSWLTVSGSFPRIRRCDVGADIVDGVYQIKASALAGYKIDESHFLINLRSGI